MSQRCVEHLLCKGHWEASAALLSLYGVLQATQCRWRKLCTHAYLGPAVKCFVHLEGERWQFIIEQSPQI